ncbi:right-handed parallel beta-helix repeat-containing protein [Methylomonas sp. BW4-1]|uniref:right-handed parallel beta-helix repeat-containing protein n=1 Tax=Methylomonas sp. BW4-1 TaxID=3376685 RepID=UPI004042E216
MFIKLVITLTLAAFCSAAAAKDFYVSPSGSDSLNGLSPSVNFWTKTGPFKTLTRARNAIRQLKATGKFNEAITVHVGKGTYQLQSALEFDERDSGLPGQEIIWQGENGISTISGGLTIKNCQKYGSINSNQILSCVLSADTVANIEGETNGRILGNTPALDVFVDERRMHMARWPNSDWAHIKTPLDKYTQFSVFEKMPSFSGDVSDAQVHIFPGNDIFDQYLGASAIDLANNRITVSDKTFYPLDGGRRFYLQNIESALDAPEEWYYDKTNNRLLLIPPKGIIPTNILISSAKNLITIKDASHIDINNLVLRYSAGDAIKIDGGDSLVLDNLELNNIGGKAVRVLNSTNITTSNSHIHDTGQGGILFSGGDRPTLTASGNIVENNHIHHYDNILFNYSPAIETEGVASIVTHNLIENGNGKAITLYGNDHVIEKNEISQICQQSGDCGAIYSGRDWTYRGNIIRYNYIHDFYGYELDTTLYSTKGTILYKPIGARGIYLDDAVSGFLVFGNILDNIGTFSIQIGGGRDNRIENNIIKTNDRAIWLDQRFPGFNWDYLRSTLKSMPITSSLWLKKYPELGTPMTNDTWPEGTKIQRNIIISTEPRGNAFRYILPRETSIIGNNIVWNATTNIRVDYKFLDLVSNEPPKNLWSEWVDKKVEQNSFFADPCLRISGGKISLTCSNSPISKISFQTLPTDIGLIK